MKPEFEDNDSSNGFRPANQSDYDANDNVDIEITAEDLSALKDEVDVLHSGDTKEAAQQLLVDKTMQSVLSIAKLATDASAERVRLDASKYIVERVLGPLNKLQVEFDADSDPIIKMMKKAGLIVE